MIPDSGKAYVYGFDVAKDDLEVRRVMTAVLPGERTLFWKLTVKENLLYFGSLYGFRRRYVKRDEEIFVQIKCSHNDFSLKEIPDFLNGHGINATNLSFDEPSLEDVFIEMTDS